jgi:small subunit ribosomal protein S18
MARREQGSRRDRDQGSRRERFVRKPRVRVCFFCKDKVGYVDYKDAATLRRYMSDRGKIRARRATGCCTKHQRDVAIAIKNAREMALLPYVSR